jgi:hypothetical protein
MRRFMFIVAAIVIVVIAVASGNGPAMLKSLETGLARGVGYQIARSLIHQGGRR